MKNIKVYMTYADDIMEKEKKFAMKRAKKNGNFDKLFSFSRHDIDKEFIEKNNSIFS